MHSRNILNAIRGLGIDSGGAVLVLTWNSGVDVALDLGSMLCLSRMCFVLLCIQPGNPERYLRGKLGGYHIRTVG